MKILGVVILVLLLSASFCASPGGDNSPKLVVVQLESSKYDTTNFITATANVKSGDSLMFTAKKINKTTTVLIPMADLLCQIDKGDTKCEVADITFLFIPLVKNENGLTSRKFIIKQHSQTTIYEYSAYIHENKKMAEEKSSPKIIVDP